MPYFLRYNTDSQEVPLGHFVDSTDGNTEETGLSIANTDIKLHKAGATTLASKHSGGGTHMSNGIYYAVFDATDTNTKGPMVAFVHVSGALAVRLECFVLDPVIYDALIGSDMLQADVQQIAGSSVSTTTAQLGVNVVKIENADATDQIRDSVVDDATRIDASALNTLSGHDPGETIMGATDLGTGGGLTSLASAANMSTLLSRIVGTLASGTHQPQSGDAYARLGTPAGASVSADIATISTIVALVNNWIQGKLEFQDDTPSVGYITMKLYDTGDSLLKTWVITKSSGNRAKAT